MPNPASITAPNAIQAIAPKIPMNQISVNPPVPFRRSESRTCFSASARARAAYRSRS